MIFKLLSEIFARAGQIQGEESQTGEAKNSTSMIAKEPSLVASMKGFHTMYVGLPLRIACMRGSLFYSVISTQSYRLVTSRKLPDAQIHQSPLFFSTKCSSASKALGITFSPKPIRQ